MSLWIAWILLFPQDKLEEMSEFRCFLKILADRRQSDRTNFKENRLNWEEFRIINLDSPQSLCPQIIVVSI